MKNYSLVILTFFILSNISAQNYSGLQNAKLNNSEPILLSEFTTGSLSQGCISGNIDSVVISADAKRFLKIKIYYTGFDSTLFIISAIGIDKTVLTEISQAKFTNEEIPSPALFVMTLGAKLQKGTKIQSFYLQINFIKNGHPCSEAVAFELNKSWVF